MLFYNTQYFYEQSIEKSIIKQLLKVMLENFYRFKYKISSIILKLHVFSN